MGKLHGFHAGILVHVLTLRAFSAWRFSSDKASISRRNFSGSSLYSPSERLIEQSGQAVFWGLCPILSIIFPAYTRSVLFGGSFNHDKLENALTAELFTLEATLQPGLRLR